MSVQMTVSLRSPHLQTLLSVLLKHYSLKFKRNAIKNARISCSLLLPKTLPLTWFAGLWWGQTWIRRSVTPDWLIIWLAFSQFLLCLRLLTCSHCYSKVPTPLASLLCGSDDLRALRSLDGFLSQSLRSKRVLKTNSVAQRRRRTICSC